MATTTSSGEQTYATLLLSDSYLPGALVLAHSLRDAGTTKALTLFFTPDSVSTATLEQLQDVYDTCIPVPRIQATSFTNLAIMNRLDLHSVFTKIHLWRQTQYSKIVYLDADVVAYRAPDELFDLPKAFYAAPDIGWPDIFNTGVMVLTPNLGDYYAMLAMAERNISFDGADQGLLNMYFKNDTNRLSFTYNVTPSGHYQYAPAYRHFQSSISMVHFIGPDKPWLQSRHSSYGSSPYDQMLGRWWAVYDRHYRAQEIESSRSKDADLHVKGPIQGQQVWQQTHHQNTGVTKTSLPRNQSSFVRSFDTEILQPVAQSQTKSNIVPLEREQLRREAPKLEQSWDAQRQPPPADSKPEAMNFPSIHYEMSSDTTLFRAPIRYPSPPKDMWYNVPEPQSTASSKEPRAIFPWETNKPPPTRSFPEPTYLPSIPTTEMLVEELEPSASENRGASGPESSSNTASQDTNLESRPTDPWTSFRTVNAWDEMPEINNYVNSFRLKDELRSGFQPVQQQPSTQRPSRQRSGLKLTDFPTEMERPSLPVTPAPRRRPSFWEDEQSTDVHNNVTISASSELSTQVEWDPARQLSKLATHSEELRRKLEDAASSPSSSQDAQATNPSEPDMPQSNISVSQSSSSPAHNTGDGQAEETESG